jgi:Ca2+-transporting ATPase
MYISCIQNYLPFILHIRYTFSSDRKRMSILVSEAGKFRLYCKGAAEMVLGLCTSVENGSTTIPMTKEIAEDLHHKIESMANDGNCILILKFNLKGLRTLCLAYRDFEKEHGSWETIPPESELTCLGFVGIKVTSNI